MSRADRAELCARLVSDPSDLSAAGAHFPDFPLHFFEESPAGHPELQAHELGRWLEESLPPGSHFSHQLDLLIRI